MSTCIPCQINKQPSPTATLKTGVDCGIDNNTSGNCALNDDGTPIVTPTATASPCGPGENCSPFDLTDTGDTSLTESYIDEQLNISGANLNVYKMLGIHEQGKLLDLAGNGNAISSGSLSNFPASNAFDKFITEWRSAQTGPNVLAKTFIGYDFGPIKLRNGRDRYGIETAVKHDISMIKIKQGCDAQNRVTKIRIERSDDGTKWYGAAIVDVPDCDGLVTLNFKRTVPSRFWRIRPLAFNGGVDDYWTVQAFQLINYEKTAITNIQDRVLLENRDRDYLDKPIAMKCYYTPIDVQANSSKFGFFQGADTYTIQISFNQAVKILGRPFVIGDILELPSETQYDPSTMEPILKYLEVNDVAWATTSYTAAWKPTMQRLLAVPAMASQETQQIFGKLTEDEDDTGLVDINDGNAKKYQDISNISKTIKAKANTAVPERGQDNADIAQIGDEAIATAKEKFNINLGKLNVAKTPYSEDAMPPNGLPYTEGEAWPAQPWKNGAYHRMTYDSKGKDIAPRLFRYLTRANRWVVIAVDRRYESRKTKPVLQEFIDPATSTVTDPKKEEQFLDKN
jgi:hypothetical protein